MEAAVGPEPAPSLKADRPGRFSPTACCDRVHRRPKEDEEPERDGLFSFPSRLYKRGMIVPR